MIVAGIDLGSKVAKVVILKDGEIISTDLEFFNQMVEGPYQRARNPWWMKMRDIADILAREPVTE